MIKFEKYDLSALTGKTLINLDKKQRFYKRMKMPMKIEKKTPLMSGRGFGSHDKNKTGNTFRSPIKFLPLTVTSKI